MKHWVYVDRAEPTEGDLETLALMFKGLPYAEIGKIRNRSKKTIESTVGKLLAETHTHNARELIYESLGRGWLKPPKQS